MSTTELGAEVGVQQKTAWLFKREVQVVMNRSPLLTFLSAFCILSL